MSGVEYMMHIGVCVTDLEHSTRFYRDGLGFKEAMGLEIDGEPTATLMGLDSDLELRALYLDREGFRIELLAYPTPGTVGEAVARPMNRLGLTHIAVRVTDLDAALERVVAYGGRILEGRRVRNEEFGSEIAYATDPDGTRLELIQTEHDPTR